MNDERPIEKMLRRYAQKRRDEAGAPPEMHPATRRLLQGEVSRQFPKSAAAGSGADSFSQTLKSWLPWLGWATVMVVVVSLGAWMFFGKPEAQLVAFGPAKNQPATVELAKNESMFTRSADKDMAETRTAGAAFKELDAPPVATPPPAQVFSGVNQPAPAFADAAGARPETKPVGTLAGSLTSDASRAPKEEANRFYATPTTSNVGTVIVAAGDLNLKATRARETLEDSARTARADKLASPRAAGSPPTLEPPAGAAGEKRAADSLAFAATGKASAADDSAVDRKLVEGYGAAKTPAAPATASARREPARQYAPLARGGGTEREKAVEYSQAFANIAPISGDKTFAKAAAAAPVLLNFQVEQTGNQLRVIDSDGSTYLGGVLAAAKSSSVAFETKGGAQLKQKSDGNLAAAPTPLEPLAAQNYFWRVEGTNRTLNQQVVFTWNFVEVTNAQARVAGDTLAKENAKTQSQLPLLQNSAINGRALLDAGREIQINAVPVRP